MARSQSQSARVRHDARGVTDQSVTTAGDILHERQFDESFQASRASPEPDNAFGERECVVRGDPVRAIAEESDPPKGIDLRIHLEPN